MSKRRTEQQGQQPVGLDPADRQVKPLAEFIGGPRQPERGPLEQRMAERRWEVRSNRGRIVTRDSDPLDALRRYITHFALTPEALADELAGGALCVTEIASGERYTGRRLREMVDRAAGGGGAAPTP